MHELSVAKNIIEIVTGYVEKENITNVFSVELDIGAVAGIIPETLEFVWDIATEDTLLKKSILKINSIKAKAYCEECLKDFEMDDIIAVCTHCNSTNYTIISGKELKIRSIKFD